MAQNSKTFAVANTRIVLEECPAGCFIALTRVSIYCHNANSVNVSAEIGFGAMSEGKNITGHPGIAAGSGFVEIASDLRYLGRGDAGEPLVLTNSVATSGSVRVNYGFEVYRA